MDSREPEPGETSLKKDFGALFKVPLFLALLVGCHTAPPAPMHVPSESTQLTRIDCIPKPGALDSEIYKHEGFALTADSDGLVLTDLETHGQDFFVTTAQTQDLKATTIGKCRSGPIHKLTQTTCLLDQMMAGL